MAMTGQDFVDSVTGHLGNRSGGLIGNQSMSDSIMQSINKGLLKISKLYRLPNLDKTLNITLAASQSTYTIPTTDTVGTVISLRNILNIKYVSGTVTSNTYMMNSCSFRETDALYSSTQTGYPKYYTVFAEKLELFPVPSEVATLVLRVSTWPTEMTTGIVSPLGPLWDDALEEFATGDCFAKLQQTLDAGLWLSNFNKTVRLTQYALTEDPNWYPTVFSMNANSYSVDPVNDAFVRRNT